MSVLTITSLFMNSTHLENNLKTGNAFIFQQSETRYLVFTTHTIVDDPSSTEALLASKIKCKGNVLDDSKLCYSKFFDVAIYKLDTDELRDFSHYSESNNDNAIQDVVVKYIDPQSDNVLTHKANYISNVLSNVSLGAITHKLNSGSSGSVVTDNTGKVVGMVTSCGDNYDNMTLVVPTRIITQLINKVSLLDDSLEPISLDNKIKFFPEILTQPLQSGHLNFLPSQINRGELVIYSEHSSLKPFDIITKCNGVDLNQTDKLTQVALDSSSRTPQKLINNIIFTLRDDWSKIYRTLPRNVFNSRIILTVGSSERISDTEISHSNNLVNGNFHPSQQVLSVTSSGVKTLHVIRNVTQSSITIYQSRPFPQEDFNLYLYHLSDVYGDFYNNPESGVNKLFVSSFIDANTTLSQDEYQKAIIMFLIRHWAFLVISSLPNLSIGKQMITWSSEVERLLELLKNRGYNTSELLRDVSFKILFKLLEFSSYHVMNMMNVFWQQWGFIVDSNLQHIKKGISEMLSDFPINSVNTLDNYPIVEVSELTFSSTPDDIEIGNTITVDQPRYIKMKIVDKKDLTVSVLVLDGFLMTGEQLTINSQATTGINNVLATHLKDGNSTYNAEGLSAEYYQLKPHISQVNHTPLSNGDLVSREIELTLKEIEKVLVGSIDISNGYQPSFFSALQSFWDHSHLTMAGIMSSIDETTYGSDTTIELTTSNMSDKPYLSTWQFKRLLQKSQNGS